MDETIKPKPDGQLAQPWPGDRLFGYTVIASTQHADSLENEYTVMLLHPGFPYYSVVIIAEAGNPYYPWVLKAWKRAENIGRAVAEYRTLGGDT